MDFIKFTKNGDSCGCDVEGNPNELVTAIYTVMDENSTVAAIMQAAVELFNEIDD